MLNGEVKETRSKCNLSVSLSLMVCLAPLKKTQHFYVDSQLMSAKKEQKHTASKRTIKTFSIPTQIKWRPLQLKKNIQSLLLLLSHIQYIIPFVMATHMAYSFDIQHALIHTYIHMYVCLCICIFINLVNNSYLSPFTSLSHHSRSLSLSLSHIQSLILVVL